MQYVYTLLSGAKGSGNWYSEDIEVGSAKEANFYVDVTAVSGTSPTLDITIEEKDPVSGKYFTIVTFSTISSVTSVRKNYGTSTGELLGNKLRAKAVIAGTNSQFTFTVSMVGKTH